MTDFLVNVFISGSQLFEGRQSGETGNLLRSDKGHKALQFHRW